MKEAVEDNFGLFSFEPDVQVDLFPISLKTLAPTAHPEARRRNAVEAAEALERSAADVIIWGRRTWLGKLDLRLTTLPSYGRTHEGDGSQNQGDAQTQGQSQTPGQGETQNQNR